MTRRYGRAVAFESTTYHGETKFVPCIRFDAYNIDSQTCMGVQVDGADLHRMKKCIDAAIKKAERREEQEAIR